MIQRMKEKSPEAATTWRKALFHILNINYLFKAKTQHAEYTHKSRYCWSDQERKWLFPETIFRNHRNPIGNHQANSRIREDVMISGFGKFQVKDKRKRRGRNPATGEDLTLPPRRVITFNCSETSRDRINNEWMDGEWSATTYRRCATSAL